MRIFGAAAIFLAALTACLLALGPLRIGLILFAIVLWFSVPGAVLATLAYRQGPGRRLAVALTAGIWGYGLSAVALLFLWWTGVRGVTLLVAPAIAAGAAWLLGVTVRDTLESPAFTKADVVAVLLLLVLALGIVGRPFAKVASPVEDGRAYRAYFTADFVWRMAIAAELSKGDFPPKNPFYRRDQLRYYWLAHLLPAAEYQVLRRTVAIEQILLVNAVAMGLAFVAFLYGFVRQWVQRTGPATAAVVGVLLFTSFEGVERLFTLWRAGAAFSYVRTLNIDAVTRWFYGSLPVDGLQRLLWYQPQHSTAYALGLSALLVIAQARGAPSPPLLALCGVLLGLCLLLSSFAAIMLTTMVAVLALILIVQARAWTRLLTGMLAGAAPLVAAVLVCLSLRYVDEGSGSLVAIGVNPMAVHNAPVAILLSFGPMLMAAMAGGVLVGRRLLSSWLPQTVIIAISIVFYFFVDLRGHQHVYVGWRAGQFLFIAFAVLAGYALQELWSMRRSVRVATALTVALLALFSAPTFAIDFYNTQDTSNRMPAAGFDWTLVLHHDELESLTWIKTFTPPDAIVQIEPFARESNSWAYIPAFAERRMSAGLPIGMVPLEKYETASAQVRALYQATDPKAAHDQAARLGIDYLIVGAPEQHAYPQLQDVLRARPDLFSDVFRRGDVAIYYVAR